MSLLQKIDRFFGADGRLAQAHAHWEPRQAQLDLARDVLSALVDNAHLLAEAGTGTGKTLAYLLPAILRRRRLIVSTGTKALQDQLAGKDIPFLQQKCGLEFTACLVKGRDNYLCKTRFADFQAAPAFTEPAEEELWPQVVDWAADTATGDMAELSELPESPAFWPEVNARESTCSGVRCPEFDSCHLQEVRRSARAADVVIVNHHLYMADATLRTDFGGILPDATTVIFDEAHRLESAATSFFGRSVSTWRLRDLADDTLRELGRADGLSTVTQVRAKRLRDVAMNFAGPFGPRPGRRLLPAKLPAAQEESLRQARGAVVGLGEALTATQTARQQADTLERRCTEIVADLNLLERRDDPAWVHYSELRGRGAFLTASPVDVSTLLREKVFSRLESSVLCSATLAIAGNMRHARERLGLAEDELKGADLQVRESIHASPFDYHSQGLLYLPRKMPLPRDPGFAAACAEQACQLVKASRGRAFLLFTSFENLGRVHEILRHDLDYPLLVQGDAPKAELLRRFLDQPESVLLATSSFWEGIDVPGEALSLVVIDKLPFTPPSDPIFAARCRLIEEDGGDPFWSLSVPEAVLRLKQGVGRLIRSATDTGVVALLDPRIRTTRHGRAFLSDLPPFRRASEFRLVEDFFDRTRS